MGRSRHRLRLLAALAWLGGSLFAFTACGPSNGGGADAGAGSNDGGPGRDVGIAPPAPPSPPAAPEPPALPEAPALPDFSTCPTGWRSVTSTSSELTTCDPWPATGTATCAEDEAHFPGEAECTRVGTECPAGDFPEGLPGGVPVLYVKPGATSGDGSIAQPFGSIAQAMTSASAGTIIALAKGTYNEAVQLRAGVTLRGACVAETRVTASGGALAVVVAVGGSARLENLRIGDTPLFGVLLDASGNFSQRFDLEDVIIQAATGAGLVVVRYALTARNVVIRGTRSTGTSPGDGIEVGPRSSAQIFRGVIENSGTAGLLVNGTGAQAHLEDVAIRDGRGMANGRFGRGAAVQNGARLVAVRSVFVNNRSAGIFLFAAGSTARLEDCVIRDTRPQASDGAFGNGAVVQAGTAFEAVRTLFHRNHEIAVSGSGLGAQVLLEDVVVRETQSSPATRSAGLGLLLASGATAMGRRIAFEGNRSSTVLLRGSGTTARLEDVIVRDTQSEERSGLFGRALAAVEGSSVSVTRALFERNSEMGLALAASHATIRDLTVRDMLPQALDNALGRCIDIEQGGQTTLSRALLERCSEIAIHTGGQGTKLDVEDVTVRDTESAFGTGEFGRGLGATSGAEVTLRRAVFERQRDVGITVNGSGTRAHLEDLVVRETGGRALDGAGGRGISAQEGASVLVRRAVLSRNRHYGVYAGGPDTTVRFEDLVIEQTLSTETQHLFGRGLVVHAGASVDVRRAEITGNREVGVFIHGQEIRARLEDLVVRDTVEDESTGIGGRAISIQEGSTVEISRALLEDNRDVALFVISATTAVEDLVVRRTRSRSSDDSWGSAIGVATGGQLTGKRLRLEDNRDVSVFVQDAGSAAHLEDTAVVGTLVRECAATTCVDYGGGTGMGAYGAGRLEVSRFLVRDSSQCGIMVARDGAMDLANGEIARNPSGACVLVPGYDIERLTRQVAYIDNGQNLDTATIYVPASNEALLDGRD